MTQSDIEFDLVTATMSCTADEVATTFAGMLREMQAAAPFIAQHERETLRWIMAHDSGSMTVGSVFPNFARDTEALTTLRKLRTAQFIRPAGRDMWDRDEHIAIKPFARLVWDRLGEDAIFGPEEETPAAVPVEEIDLSLPEVNEPESKETVRLKNKDVAQWDDDDVLDFLGSEKSVVK